MRKMTSWPARAFGLAAAIGAFALSAPAQAPLPIYTDHLVNGFQDWSWGTHNLSYSVLSHSGTNSVSLSGTAWNVALSLNHSAFNSSPYAGLSFWADGGSGGQVLQVFAQLNGVSQPADTLTRLPANTWVHFVISLATLGAESKTNVNQFTIQLTNKGTTNAFYIDDIQLTAKLAPALAQVNLNPTQAIRTADSRWSGFNTAIWDNSFDTSQTSALLKEIGATTLRFPGGSLSDDYHWATDTTDANTWRWVTSFANFVHVATNVGAQAFITVNYGTGTSAEAAGWVRSSNLTNHYGFKYWEVGNECYGSWETDSNTYPHDPYTYATRAADYLNQMKAADPTIKVGVVVTPGEDSSANGYNSHPATNSLTGQVHYGWTPVLLNTLKSLGVTPDFAIYHRYPEYTDPSVLPACPDSDPLLLQNSVGWAADAADLRRQITGYFGPAGTNIELVCTENNSDAGAQGRQSTSLVNGLYYADSLGQVMQTEMNAFVWWDLRNGSDTSGSFDPTLYGWRTNGDLGIIGGLNTRYPPFYAAKLFQYLVRAGDTVLSASSDYLLLSAYAVRPTDGGLSLLVLNKDTVTNINAQINLGAFTPYSTATIRSYGIPQDTAAQTGVGSPDLYQTNFTGAAPTFNYSFPPLSLTLFNFSPAAPSLTVMSSALTGGQFVFQLSGQTGARYVIQSSPDFVTWTSIATNLLTAPTTNLSFATAASPGGQFYRAKWPP